MAVAKNDEAPSTEVDTQGPRDASGMIASLNEVGSGMFSTIKGSDRETKRSIAKALTNSVPAEENRDKLINLDQFIIQSVELTDPRTGEKSIAPRVTLIDADGTAYHATSVGILSSLRTLLAVYGAERAEWGEPIPVKVTQAKTNSGYRVFTLVFE